ncbi:META domain-containing protein [Halomonas beimenensis]|uniref:DUF306 domain-containing protein n=1 Tax=Halomonas beimenensis TaxID=475662 RepID=A0A291PB16_9GAMM|nr:META domain-containing protein [Halomonas beimenensis]ATJ84062.1 hypothetical protein BEI_3075 [Halomonas beimenensis]
MKRIFDLSFFLLIALWLAGCAALERSPEPRAVLGQLPASFRGELPCADCPGIRYHLSLFPDGIYTLKATYLGEGERRRFHEQGRWAVDGAGRTLTLAGGDQGPRQWRIHDSASLEMLDLEGQAIVSALDYRLQRTEAFVTETLENTYWKLIELGGVPVEPVAREPHLIFQAEQGRLVGATGCNRLTGRYRREGQDLTLGPLASTRMACLDGMQVESRFLAMLERVVGFRVLADRLELYGAEGELLARFEVRHLT